MSNFSNPWFDPSDTVVIFFDEDSHPACYGHWLELYGELSDEMSDAIGASAVRGLRDITLQDGTKAQEINISAKGLAANQALLWIKSWSFRAGRADPLPEGKGRTPSVLDFGKLKASVSTEIQKVIDKHSAEAAERTAVAMDPIPADTEIEPDDSPMSELPFSTDI